MTQPTLRCASRQTTNHYGEDTFHTLYETQPNWSMEVLKKIVDDFILPFSTIKNMFSKT